MTRTILYDFRSSICSQMARLALEEKGVAYSRREVDIMIANEQFEPWYVELNPNSVVPIDAPVPGRRLEGAQLIERR